MYLIDPIAGIYVDEAAGLLFGMDVNADEQIVKYYHMQPASTTPSKPKNQIEKYDLKMLF